MTNVTTKTIHRSDVDLIHNKFVDEMNLKHMFNNFYMSPDIKVYLYSSKKQKWYDWRLTTLSNGAVVFKTKLLINNMKVDKWIQVHDYTRKLFPDKFGSSTK